MPLCALGLRSFFVALGLDIAMTMALLGRANHVTPNLLSGVSIGPIQ